MITLSGLRNAFWCAVAFGIVACASAPLTVDEPAHEAEILPDVVTSVPSIADVDPRATGS